MLADARQLLADHLALVNHDEPEIVRELRAVLRFDVHNLRGVLRGLAGALLRLFLLRSGPGTAAAAAHRQQAEQHVLTLQLAHQRLRHSELQLAKLDNLRFHRRPQQVLRIVRVPQNHQHQLPDLIVHVQQHLRQQIRLRFSLRRMQAHELGHVQRVRIDDSRQHLLNLSLGFLREVAHGAVVLLMDEAVDLRHGIHGQLIHLHDLQIICAVLLVQPVCAQLQHDVLRGRAGRVGQLCGMGHACQTDCQRQQDPQKTFHMIIPPFRIQWFAPHYSK